MATEIATRRLPTVRQMEVRCNPGHVRLLEAFRDGRKIPEPCSMGELKGLKTVLATLYRWDCLDGDSLTERGSELLAAWKAKRAG